MTHYVICPYSKPEYLDNLLGALGRQTFRDFTPIIVENGPAVGTFPALAGAVVLQSDAHQSLAKNLAMKWVREHGDASWSVFDCDDYYGPLYLQTQLDGLLKRDIAGKSFSNMMYIKYDEGIYLSCAGIANIRNSLTGGTISCRTAHVMDYPLISVGEDGFWFSQMVQKGAAICNTGPRYYCYNRSGGGHTWAPDKQSEEALKRNMVLLGDVSVTIADQPPRFALESSERVHQVVMLYTPDYTPGHVSVPDVRHYCGIWDYEFKVYEDKIDPTLPAAWGKILGSLRALEQTPENEWVMWMDADMLFRRHNSTLESLIDPSKDFMISVDHRGLCTGLFLIRNTPLMREFFTELLTDVRMDWPWEQDAMKDLLGRRLDIAARVGHIPETIVQNPSTPQSSKALVMHYWGNAYPTRQALTDRMRRDILYRDTGRNRGRLFAS